jgi:colicin import membrane protein
MIAVTSDRPGRAPRVRGKWVALMLALFVNLLFIGVLVFSVSWQNRAPEAVSAELYAPPPVAAKPPPKVQPQPQPQVEPPPEPPPQPKPAPTPPVVAKPDPVEAEIALKAKREVERVQRGQAERAERERMDRERVQRERIERERVERERTRQAQEARQADERRLADDKKQAEERKQADEKKQAEAKKRQQVLEAQRAEAEKEARQRAQAERDKQMRAQAERESQLRAQAERDKALRAQADQEARGRAAAVAAQGARNKAQGDWIDKIRARIRGYIILPPDIPNNPEAIFDVVQLPTGAIIDVRLRKSSGIHAYDDAVQRAILKASPLPRPVPADLFQRSLELHFRPLDP